MSATNCGPGRQHQASCSSLHNPRVPAIHCFPAPLTCAAIVGERFASQAARDLLSTCRRSNQASHAPTPYPTFRLCLPAPDRNTPGGSAELAHRYRRRYQSCRGAEWPTRLLEPRRQHLHCAPNGLRGTADIGRLKYQERGWNEHTVKARATEIEQFIREEWG